MWKLRCHVKECVDGSFTIARDRSGLRNRGLGWNRVKKRGRRGVRVGVVVFRDPKRTRAAKFDETDSHVVNIATTNAIESWRHMEGHTVHGQLMREIRDRGHSLPIFWYSTLAAREKIAGQVWEFF